MRNKNVSTILAFHIIKINFHIAHKQFYFECGNVLFPSFKRENQKNNKENAAQIFNSLKKARNHHLIIDNNIIIVFIIILK